MFDETSIWISVADRLILFLFSQILKRNDRRPVRLGIQKYKKVPTLLNET